MNPTVRSVAVAVLVSSAVALLPSPARAGGFSVSEHDARATGRSGAGIAAEPAPSAVHYNPASLIGLGGPAASVGLSAIMPRISAKDPVTGLHEENAPGMKTPPHVFAAWGLEKTAFGLGFNAPFGGGVKWSDDWRGRFELVEMKLEVLALHASAAYALSPEWSIGATVSGYQMNVSVDRRIDFVSTEGRALLGGRGLGAGAGVGVNWSPQSLGVLRRVGVVGRLPLKIALHGRAHFEDVPDAFAPNTQDQAIRSSLTLPARVGLGSQWAFGGTQVYADAELTFWSSFRSFDVDFEDAATPDVSQPRNWRTAGTFRLGVERELGGFTARVGGLFDMSASPSDTLSPSLPDSHRLGATLGVGKGFGKLRGDLAYMLVSFLPRASTGEALPASYSALAHLFALTVSFGG